MVAWGQGPGSSSWWWSIKPQNDCMQAIVPLQGSQHLTLIFNCRKYNSQTKTHIPDKARQLIFQTSLMQIWAKGFKFVQSDFYRCLTITQLLQLLEALMFLKEQTPHSLGFLKKISIKVLIMPSCLWLFVQCLTHESNCPPYRERNLAFVWSIPYQWCLWGGEGAGTQEVFNKSLLVACMDEISRL